jgi:oligopeptide transport system ATP-binding protein
LGLVGESGSGKSVTALSILGLVPSPPGRIVSGSIMFDRRDLVSADNETLRRTRGRDIGMIFQEPMTALNPVVPIGRQVAEPLMAHFSISRSEAMKKAARWLDRLRIPSAANRLSAYPHELSGGMRQRVMIAMAMICRPRLLIADEPTTALDVTLQRQILHRNGRIEIRAEFIHDAHHPRSRRGGTDGRPRSGNVCRQDHGKSGCSLLVCQSVAPLHEGD